MNAEPIDINEITQKRVDRFWSKVNKTETCWLWIGGTNVKGYGVTWFGTKLYRSHRMAYYLHHRKDPYPMQVLHTCDNPLCVNPKHLFLGDNLDNIKDKMAKGRYNHIEGSQCGSAILDETLVKLIKEYLKEGIYTDVAIARAFHVSKPTIGRIRKGETWKHVII